MLDERLLWRANLEQPHGTRYITAEISNFRGADLLTLSNWETLLNALKGHPHEIVRYRNSLNGWNEFVIFPADSTSEAIYNELYQSLQEYPALDEDDYQARCHNEYLEAWNDWGKDEFCYEIKQRFNYDDETMEKVEELSSETLRQLYENALKDGYERYIIESSGVVLFPGQAVAQLDEELLFAHLAPHPPEPELN